MVCLIMGLASNFVIDACTAWVNLRLKEDSLLLLSWVPINEEALAAGESQGQADHLKK
jgi:hypothetical protein